jgi:hypothetical protein
MNKRLITVFAIFALLSICLAQKVDTVRFAAPVLITAAGQSADGLMLKILCHKAEIAFIYGNLATGDSLLALIGPTGILPVVSHDQDGHGTSDTLSPRTVKTLILVPGGSTKGLGAARMDEKQEIARMEDVIQVAQDRKIPILLCHLGGMARRGSLSDMFNLKAAEAADAIVVVKGGNDDGFFTIIAQKRNVPIYQVENILEVTQVLKQLFGKE